MPSVTTDVPHSLTVPEAASRVKTLMTHLKVRYGSKITDVDEWWGKDRGDFSFRFSGLKIKGTVDVTSSEVRAKIDLPLAALPFKSAIRGAIHDQLAASLR